MRQFLTQVSGLAAPNVHLTEENNGGVLLARGLDRRAELRRASSALLLACREVQGNGGEPLAGTPLPARQSRAALMDRYDSHTCHCRSCSGALRWIRRIRPLAWGVLWVSACLVGLGQAGGLSIAGLLLGTLAGLVVRQSNRWEQGLMAGDGIAPRNQP